MTDVFHPWLRAEDYLLNIVIGADNGAKDVKAEMQMQTIDSHVGFRLDL